MSDIVPDAFIKTAHSIADEARKIAQQYWRTGGAYSLKNDASPVSLADKGIEAKARQILEENHPKHSIIGEEEASVENNSDWTWIIDPIDGTKAFISGGYYWGVMIALSFKGDFVLGLIDFPCLDERYVGVQNKTTTLNGTEVSASAITALNESRGATTSPDYFNDEGQIFLEDIRKNTAVFSYGGDCFLSANVARGDLELVIESGLSVYDIAAAVPIIDGAGGVITTWQGERPNLQSFSDIIICANEELHKNVLSLHPS